VGVDNGLQRLVRRPLEEEEAVVEADRSERRRDPPAGVGERRSVRLEPHLRQHLGEVEPLRHQRHAERRDPLGIRLPPSGQDAGLLEELPQRGGGDAGRQDGVERLQALGDGLRHGRVGPCVAGHGGELDERDLAVAARHAAAGKGVPAPHEVHADGALDPEDLQVLGATTPQDDAGRGARWRQRRRLAGRHPGQHLVVERRTLHRRCL
jgi:hypothetical protein